MKQKKSFKDEVKAEYTGWAAFNVFRYLLTLLFVAGKVGLFASPVLAPMSWWIVLLPAYVFETVMLGVAAVAFVLSAVLWLIVAGAKLLLGKRVPPPGALSSTYSKGSNAPKTLRTEDLMEILQRSMEASGQTKVPPTEPQRERESER